MKRNFYAFFALLLLCLFAFYLSSENLRLKTVNTFTLANSVKNKEESAEKIVYLTFDDGPTDSVTPKILDILKEEKVRATFFIIGKQAETRKEIVKRAFNEGHTVAVHSYSHDYKNIYKSSKSLLEDINKCNKIIFDITGKESKIYRFPGGSYGLDKNLVKAVTDSGYKYVDWNASNCDAEYYDASPEELYTAAVSTSANRQNVVLLAHDSVKKLSTVKMLKKIISYYKANGYKFATF
ncbi:MAG: polysaccharide deacetylase [Clostridiales bacterium]|nr:polysaccharide deacetylase [Clostridiales bacterium]